MSQIDPTTVDVDEVIRRIQAVHRGELPANSVSTEELRAAVEAQRLAFSTSARAAASSEGSTKTPAARKTVGKLTLTIPGLDDLL